MSADDPAAVQEALPAIDHRGPGRRRRPADALAEQVAGFRPHIVYGQTHKALPDLARVSGRDRPLRVADLHGDYPRWRLEQHWRPAYRRLLSYTRFRFAEWRHCKAMDGFTVVSDLLARRVRGMDKPVEVLWGGVDLDRFRPAAAAGGEKIRVAYAGNFQPYHGLGCLLEAARRLIARSPEFHFTLIGNIDEFPAVRHRAETQLAGHVTITGQVPYERIPGLLSEADVLVIPRASSATARSTYPSKLSEALALGKALVTTAVGEVPRVVRDGETALLVPPEDPGELETALYRLRDAELRGRLGRSARQLAEDRLGWQRIAERAGGFFARLLEGAA